jgi:hypothetical protein
VSVLRFADVLSKTTRPERPVAYKASDFCGQHDKAKGTEKWRWWKECGGMMQGFQ